MLSNHFKYYKVDSCIHSLNPLCKILLFFIFILITLFSSSIKSFVALFIVLSFIVGLSNVPYKKLFSFIWSIKYFLVFVLLISLFFKSYLIFRFCFIVLYYQILVISTRFQDFVKGFYLLFSPLKVFGISIHRICVNCSLILYFIPFFVSEYECAQLNYSFEHGLKNIFYFFVNVFFSTYRKIVKKRDIMLMRGFSFNDSSFAWRLSDVYIVVCYLMVLVLVLVKEVVV